MTTTETRTLIECMDRKECLRMLAGDSVGRLAIVHGGAPVIFPVNYALDGEDIVFRTDPGTKLGAGPRSPACFEIDALDRKNRSGWSVVASGRLEEVTEYDWRRWQRIRLLAITPWALGDKSHWMRLVPERITGRYVGPT